MQEMHQESSPPSRTAQGKSSEDGRPAQSAARRFGGKLVWKLQPRLATAAMAPRGRGQTGRAPPAAGLDVRGHDAAVLGDRVRRRLVCRQRHRRHALPAFDGIAARWLFVGHRLAEVGTPAYSIGTDGTLLPPPPSPLWHRAREGRSRGGLGMTCGT